MRCGRSTSGEPCPADSRLWHTASSAPANTGQIPFITGQHRLCRRPTLEPDQANAALPCWRVMPTLPCERPGWRSSSSRRGHTRLLQPKSSYLANLNLSRPSARHASCRRPRSLLTLTLSRPFPRAGLPFTPCRTAFLSTAPALPPPPPCYQTPLLSHDTPHTHSIRQNAHSHPGSDVYLRVRSYTPQ